MKVIENLFRSEYIKNISIQVLGTGLAQFIPLIASPILARLYTEEGFAVFSLFMAIVAVLIVPNGGKYHLAIVLPKKDKKAVCLAELSFWITIFYNLFLFVIILLFYSILNEHFTLGNIWFVIPIYVVFFGIYSIVLYLSVREKSFKRNALAKTIQTSTTTICSILMSFVGLFFSGLILGKMMGLITSIPFFKVKLELGMNFKKLKSVAREFSDYPKLTIVPALLDIFSLQALVLFVGTYFSEATLGYLGLANIILVAPAALVGYAFRDVFYQKASAYTQKKEIEKVKKLFLKSALVLFIIGALFALVLFLFGEEIFVFIYGKNWRMAGLFSSIICFSIWGKLVSSPLSTIFNVTNNLKLLLIWQIVYFFTTIITLYLSIVYFNLSIILVLVVYTIYECLIYIIYFLLQLWTLKK